MRIIKKQALIEFWKKHPDAKSSLEAWYYEVKNCVWKNPSEIKRKYNSVSILKKGRIVFNIKGNQYRLVVKIEFKKGIVYIRFIGTHDEYDSINVEKI